MKNREFEMWYKSLPEKVRVAIGLFCFGPDPKALVLWEFYKKKRLEDFVRKCWIKKLPNSLK